MGVVVYQPPYTYGVVRDIVKRWLLVVLMVVVRVEEKEDE